MDRYIYIKQFNSITNSFTQYFMIVTFTFEICDYKHVSKWHNISMIGNVAASIESTSYGARSFCSCHRIGQSR